MKQILPSFIVFVFLLFACQQQKKQPKESSHDSQKELKQYMNLISADELNASLHFLASDYFEGRATGTRGQVLAANYLASTLAMMGVTPLNANTSDSLANYFHLFPFKTGTGESIGQNVVGFIEGSDPKLKEEIVVFSAHYDHLGMDTNLKGDQIFNGAADDGSGIVTLLEVAESFARAKENGQGPKRSVLFAFFAGEEIGLIGSYYSILESPSLPIDKIVADINLDGVAGFDLKHPRQSKNYVYALLNDSTSIHLAEKAKSLNALPGIGLEIDKPLRPEQFASDSRPFEYLLIPTIYLSTGLTEHYHKISDDPATIDYQHMARITKLVFALGWEVSNSDSLNAPLNRKDYERSGKYICHPCGCGKDNGVFDAPGRCPACTMQLNPQWKKKS